MFDFVVFHDTGNVSVDFITSSNVTGAHIGHVLILSLSPSLALSCKVSAGIYFLEHLSALISLMSQ